VYEHRREIHVRTLGNPTSANRWNNSYANSVNIAVRESAIICGPLDAQPDSNYIDRRAYLLEP